MDDDEDLKASQTSEGRYRMLVNAVTDYAIYMLDPDGIDPQFQSDGLVPPRADVELQHLALVIDGRQR